MSYFKLLHGGGLVLFKQDLGTFSENSLKPTKSSYNPRDFANADESSRGDTDTQKIEAEARANGTWLKAPNGKPSKLSERQWVQVRTAAFKKWFGDWEKAARIEKLKKAPTIELTDYTGQYELNRDSARKWALENLRTKYVINDTGENIELQSVGAKKVTSHSTDSEVHLKSIASIPILLKNAIFISETQSEKDNAKFDSYRYYVAGIKIEGVDYTARITVGVKNGKRFYDHSLTQIEKGILVNLASNKQGDKNASNGFKAKGSTTVALSSADVKDKRLLSILQVDSSKVVDENGEPLVVYHGSRTRNPFTVFDPSKGSSIDGVYHSSRKAVAARFSGTSEIKRFDNKGVFDRIYGAETFDELKKVAAEIGSVELISYKKTGKEYQLTAVVDGYVNDNALRSWVNPKTESELLSKTKELVAHKFVVKNGDSSIPYGNLYASYLNIHDPLVIDANGKGFWEVEDSNGNTHDTEFFARQAEEQNADGLIVRNVKEGLYKNDAEESDVFVSFSPSQIKSATDNVGMFDGGNADIRYSAGSAFAPTEAAKRQWEKDRKAKMAKRDALLAMIAKKTGIKIVKESAAQINASAQAATQGRFSAMRRRKLHDNEWFIPSGKDYARLASQVGTLWSERRDIDVYYLDETVFVCKKRRTHGDFEVLDAFHVEVSNEEFEERRQEATRRLVDSEAQGVLGAVRVYRDAFGRDNGGASRVEDGGANEIDGRLDDSTLGEDGKNADAQPDNDKDAVYTKSGTLIAYRVGGEVGKQRYKEDAKRVGLRFKAESAFHGSPHNFAAEENAPLGRFRDDKMGSGEGAQAFGWGHYLTSEDGIGRRYANELAARKHAGVASLIVLEQIQGQLDQGGIWQLYGKDGMLRKAQLEKPDDVSEGWKFVPLTAESRKHFEQQKTTVEKELAMFEAKGVDVRNRRHLYTAEFDDATLLDWTKPLTREQLRAFQEQLGSMSDEAFEAWLDFYNKLNDANEEKGFGRWFPTPEYIHTFAKKAGEEETVSKALFAAGFVGHKFPAASHGAGDYSKGTNYVIYDESALRITNKVSWLQRQGTIYGYFDPVRRELHLNEDFADFDTPIHEWTHVWWAWLKGEDPRMIERIVELMKQTKEFKAFRISAMTDKSSVYHGLSEEDMAQEVFARFMGKRGEDIMEQEGLGTWAKIRRYALDFFKGVMRTLGLSQEEVDSLTFEDVQNMCLRDLFDNETLGIKGLRLKINQRAALMDAIDNAAMDWSIEDATRKRGIRNASVLVAAKMVSL